MEFKLTYLGHASFFFETKKAGILMDPWFSPYGAFMGSWRPLPPVNGQQEFIKNKSKEKKIYCFVSHNHQDHLDIKTLKNLNSYISEYIIVNYENKNFRNILYKIDKQKVSEIDELFFFKRDDITMYLFREESGINKDSAIYCKHGDKSFLNFNDCKIFDRTKLINDELGKINVVTGQFSGAVMHPHSYNYSEEERAKIVNQKKRRKFMAISKFLKELSPECFIPSAGPPLLYGENLNKINFQENTTFPRNYEFYEWWRTKKILDNIKFHELKPLSELCSSSIKKINSNSCKKITNKDLEKYIEYYKAYDEEDVFLSEEAILKFLHKEFSKKLIVLKKIQKDIRPKGKFSFVIDNNYGLTVNFDKLIIENWSDTERKPNYTHKVNGKHISKMIRMGETWENYYLSMDFLNERAPDIYDTKLMLFLISSGPSEMNFGFKKLDEYRSTDNMITLKSKDGKKIKCSRFCPHAGADLTNASFDGRYIVCPRHGWRFDLENNGKEVQNNEKIKIELLDD